jgi:hypothetical protein
MRCPAELPVGVSAFAEEIYQAPKSWAEEAYVKLIYYSSHPKGTRFAAWEQPALSCPMCAQPSNRFVRCDNEKNGARVRRAPHSSQPIVEASC